MNNAETVTTTKTPMELALARSKHDNLTPAAVRVLLKQNLKLNARQVTVKTGSSHRYLTITVRDALVDLVAVRAFAKRLTTWTMDQSDYCEGQSLSVTTTEDVDNAHAAPFIPEICRAINTAMTELRPVTGCNDVRAAVTLSTGGVLWLTRQGFYIGHDQERAPYISELDAVKGAGWALTALALQMATLSARVAAEKAAL